VKLPLLLSVPHAGLRVPEEVRHHCRLTTREITEDGDEGAAQIYDLAAEVDAFLTTDVARAIVDLNRAEGDRGRDGVVKTHTVHGVPIYDPTPSEERFAELLDRYYRPYHRRLRELAQRPSVRLGIDCHTMLAVGPAIGPGAGLQRPLICLSDGHGATCPSARFEVLAAALEETFGFPPARNDPFSGGFISRTHAAELPWVQLELSRAPFASNAQKRERVLRALRLAAPRLG
jgi:formiminoglutamase